MIGRRLGHFRVIEQIGAGGMGVVYRARDERLHRDVALKVLPEGALADERARKRFRREALALSQLNHPNIETIYDFDSDQGVDFLVIELIEGVTLDEKLAAGPLPEREIVSLGLQLAQGLEAAHAQGVYHRDLKPANLRVTPDGRLKILDFGLARLHRMPADVSMTMTVTERGEIAGTLRYLAPEQLKGEPPDARGDIYSVGAVLYEMAAGRGLFPDAHTAQLLFAIVNQEPEPPRGLRPGLSAELEAVILKAIAKEPGRRHQTAAELRDQLAAVAPAGLAEAARVEPVATRRRGARRQTRERRWLVPVAGALMLGLSVAAWLWWGRGGVSDIDALAVLPLANLSRDPEQEYFADGMTDQLITDLSQVEALRVISRSAVMDYKKMTKPLRQIARELKVDALVEGSVVQANQRVRISAQLVSASTAQNMWADSFEGDLKDVLTLQKNVARAIVEKIRAKLRPDEQKRLATARTVNPEAYQVYLKARYTFNEFTEKGFRQTEALFRKAIELDPGYAAAYAGLGDAYYGLSNLYMAPNDAMPRARALALKALELDETNADAHTTLAIVKTVFDWDWEGAEREFKRSLELRPNDALTRLHYAHNLIARGHFEEGVVETRKATELDPVTPWITAYMGWHLHLAHHDSEAVRELRKLVELSPDQYLAYALLGNTLDAMGDHAEAIAALEKAMKMEPNPDGLAQLGHAYARGGRKGDAQRLLTQLLDRRKKGFVPAADIAIIYAGLGDRKQTLDWLEQACDDHSEFMIFVAIDPVFDDLRSDPRMAAILRKLGLAGQAAPAAPVASIFAPTRPGLPGG